MTSRLQPIFFGEALRDVRPALSSSAKNSPPAAELLKASYEQGVRDGEKALTEQLLQQRNELLELQQGLLKSLSQCLPQLRLDCESTLVDIALTAAQKLVAGLPISADMVAAAVKEGLDHCEATQELSVLLHPDDLNLLQRVNSPVLLTNIGGESIRFEASQEVTRGGCLVQSRFGILDARRETKLELLRKSLRN